MMIINEPGALELSSMCAAWRSLGERWKLSPVEIAMLLPEGGERSGSPPADTERRMRMMLEIGRGLGFDGQRLSEWLRDPRQDLFFLSPIEAMADSRYLRRLRSMVEAGVFS